MSRGGDRTAAETVAGLMIMAGALTVVSATPCGLSLGLKDYFAHGDRWTLVFGGSVTATATVVGSLLVWGGRAIAKRSWKPQDESHS